VGECSVGGVVINGDVGKCGNIAFLRLPAPGMSAYRDM
jgi:hypothetical protein